MIGLHCINLYSFDSRIKTKTMQKILKLKDEITYIVIIVPILRQTTINKFITHK